MPRARHGHIVALGGGGFSVEPENPLLDDFVLALSRRKPAHVCFVPTASADSAEYIVKFYRAFSGRCIPTDLTIFASPALPRHGTAGYAADDGAALHFVGTRLREVVSSRPAARAYRLAVKGGKVVETSLPTRFLKRPGRSGVP